MTTSAHESDDLPCDLLVFLALTRDIDVGAAQSQLGDFLIQYESPSATPANQPRGLAA
jgi:hypothetical protein